MKKLLILFKHCYNGSRGEVELDHVIRYMKKYNQDIDAMNILRNLKLELRQDWTDKIHEMLG